MTEPAAPAPARCTPEAASSNVDSGAKTFVIFRGTSGMGKSHIGSRLEARDGAIVCSNNEWWEKHAKGRAWSLSTHCSVALPWCEAACRRALKRGRGLVVLDNINMKKNNFVEHLIHARRGGYRVLIVELIAPTMETARAAAERHPRDWGPDRERKIQTQAGLYAGYERFSVKAMKGVHRLRRTTPNKGNAVYKWIKAHVQRRPEAEISRLAERMRAKSSGARGEELKKSPAKRRSSALDPAPAPAPKKQSTGRHRVHARGVRRPVQLQLANAVDAPLAE